MITTTNITFITKMNASKRITNSVSAPGKLVTSYYSNRFKRLFSSSLKNRTPLYKLLASLKEKTQENEVNVMGYTDPLYSLLSKCGEKTLLAVNVSRLFDSDLYELERFIEYQFHPPFTLTVVYNNVVLLR